MTEYENWVAQYIPRLDGRTVIVTGANSGLGFEAAKLLAARGAVVVLAVRNLAKGREAAARICEETPSARLELLPLDLADLGSVGRFAEEVRASQNKLHALINNAGVMAIPQRSTADGFEMQFGTNHLGHFALTGLLLPLLLRTPEARVVTVSSGIHIIGRINFDDLQSEERYSDFRVYAQSKLANLLFTYELQRKFEEAGARCSALAAHPGYASTNLQAVGPTMAESKARQFMMKASNRLLAQPAAMGALPLIYAATSPDAQGGEYYGPAGLFGQRGYPKVVKSSAASYDEAVAKRLWQVSEELTGVTYRFK
ncbi:MAG: oxidoreductase [Anaerolineae bacterium]|jgi:NAD(P)-dependent dehydrogenase (short-subunit alcohol dehydrogenase family)|nr:oxidoreductase [Anaerolineae bacterium]